MAKITPPDIERCQCERPNGATSMTIGAVPGLVRCGGVPIVIATERKATHKDGKKGSMSLCVHCTNKMIEQLGKDFATFKPLRGNPTTVVNVQAGKRYDVYIGRPSDWGNPFQIGVDGTRQEVIELYRLWLRYERPDLIERAKRELKGKVLGCWCSPEACHGDVLASICDEEWTSD